MTYAETASKQTICRPKCPRDWRVHCLSQNSGIGLRIQGLISQSGAATEGQFCLVAGADVSNLPLRLSGALGREEVVLLSPGSCWRLSGLRDPDPGAPSSWGPLSLAGLLLSQQQSFQQLDSN